MAILYGHRWIQPVSIEEKEIMKMSWLNILDGISDAQVDYAISYCEKDRPLDENGQSWPPNPREFLEFCRRMPKPEAKVERRSEKTGYERVRELKKSIESFSWQLANYGDVMSEENKSATRRAIDDCEKEVYKLTKDHGLAI
jgi:hypothetical protein